MKGFQLTTDQISTIACGLAVEILARDFNHYIDFMARGALCAQTRFSDEALSLDEDEIAACQKALYGYFGQIPDQKTPTTDQSFGSWAENLQGLIFQNLVSFDFNIAQPNDADPPRYSADALWQDARVVASFLHGRRRVVSFVSPHSLFGLVSTIIAPNLQGIETLDGRGINPEELTDILSFGDMIVATPTIWRYLAQTLPVLTNNIIGISYGGALTLPLASKLRDMGLGAMREFYGSTRTGLISWRDSPTEQFVLFDHWYRSGEDIIRLMPDNREESVASMDYFNWRSERGFTLGARRDGAVRIGAINVFPEKIAKVIAVHPEIEKCDIRIVDESEETLSKLVAHIELKPGVLPNQTTAWKMDAWCRAQLRPPERPSIYRFEEVSATQA